VPGALSDCDHIATTRQQAAAERCWLKCMTGPTISGLTCTNHGIIDQAMKSGAEGIRTPDPLTASTVNGTPRHADTENSLLGVVKYDAPQRPSGPLGAMLCSTFAPPVPVNAVAGWVLAAHTPLPFARRGQGFRTIPVKPAMNNAASAHAISCDTQRATVRTSPMTLAVG
jgi:hypothetical protein